jgi:hypothetical protein
MFATPVAPEVAIPVTPMVAMEGADELQITKAERFCVVPSVNVPVAVNCSLVPSGMEVPPEVTEMDIKTADETVSPVWPDTPPDVAVMVALPIPCAVASPLLLTLAVLVLVDAHVTVDVKFCVLPSE